MQKALFLLFATFALAFSSAYAQDDSPFDGATPAGEAEEESTEEAIPFGKRLFFEGGGQLNFWNNSLVLGADPMVGVWATDRLMFAAGGTVLYIRERVNTPGYSYENDQWIYGPRAFARFLVSPTFFAQAEADMIHREYWDNFLGRPTQGWVSGAYLGGGYRVQLGQRSAVNMMILYNFLHNQYKSLYASPLVTRVSFQL